MKINDGQSVETDFCSLFSVLARMSVPTKEQMGAGELDFDRSKLLLPPPPPFLPLFFLFLSFSLLLDSLCHLCFLELPFVRNSPHSFPFSASLVSFPFRHLDTMQAQPAVRFARGSLSAATRRYRTQVHALCNAPKVTATQARFRSSAATVEVATPRPK